MGDVGGPCLRTTAGRGTAQSQRWALLSHKECPHFPPPTPLPRSQASAAPGEGASRLLG